jgi:hypothetical protein
MVIILSSSRCRLQSSWRTPRWHCATRKDAASCEVRVTRARRRWSRMVGRSFTFSAGGGRPWPGIWLGDRGNRRDKHSPARTGGSTRGQSHSKLPTGLNAAGERLLADCLRLEVRSLRPLSVLGFSTAAVLVDTKRRRRCASTFSSPTRSHS